MPPYIPHNDIIRKALTFANQYSDQNIDAPPYSASVRIAKNMLEDALQRALDDFDGIYGLQSIALLYVSIANPSGHAAWVFPSTVSLLNIQGIKSIYVTSPQGDRTPIDWFYWDSVGANQLNTSYIMTDGKYGPQEPGGSHAILYCDYIYFWTDPGGATPQSSGHPRRFSDYAALLLARYISDGMGSADRGNQLMVLAQQELVRSKTKFSTSQKHLSMPPSSIQKAIM